MKILSFFAIFAFAISSAADFVKISENGQKLDDDAEAWACVLDTEKNRFWEVKKNVPGVQNFRNTYTWFDGISGVENDVRSQNCHRGENCNTRDYVAEIRRLRLCGFDDWRLPSAAELHTIVRYQDDEPLIDTRFFPHTAAASYWTSDTSADNPEVALDVPFFYGGSPGSGKSFDSHIRLVRHAK